MKRTVLAVLILAIIIVVGASGSVYFVFYHHPNPLKISNFDIENNTIEHSTSANVTFSVLASSPGQADYRIFIVNDSVNLTLESGTFLKTLNITNESIALDAFSGISSGTYSVGISIVYQNFFINKSRLLSLLPHVSFTSISGPKNVTDSSGEFQASYAPTSISGGSQPYHYEWSVNTSYTGNIQNYSETNSNHSGIFTVLFYQSSSGGFPTGPTAIYYISLTITDSFGFNYTVTGYSVTVKT